MNGRNAYVTLDRKSEGKRPLGRPTSWRNRVGRCGLDSFGSRYGYGPVEGSCIHGKNNLQVLIKGRHFLNYQLVL
jgi:hypothetical protein